MTSADVDAAPETAEAAETATAEAPRRTVAVMWLTESSIQRLQETTDLEVTDDLEAAGEADLVAVSTRIPTRATLSAVEELQQATTAPLVAVCHASGETTAIDFMRMGFAGVVAEGNERALRSFINPEAFAETMIDSIAPARQGASPSAQPQKSRLDRITNLPEQAAFEVRFRQLVDEGVSPQLLMVRIVNFNEAIGRLDGLTVELVRRRLGSAISNVISTAPSELFALNQSTFAVLGVNTIVDPAELADAIIELTSTFSPAGTPLVVAIGYSGPESDPEAATIREQAERALEAAATSDESSFVNAEDVTVLMAASTELEVAKQLMSRADELLPYPEGHSARVAEHAVSIARELGFQGRDLNGVRLAAMLHDVGRVAGSASEETPATDDGEFAERGARYALPSAGPSVAEAIRHQLERWDGSGPGGLSGGDIPVVAQIIAVADRVDSWLEPGDEGAPLSAEDLGAKLKELGDSEFEPRLTETAVRLFGAA